MMINLFFLCMFSLAGFVVSINLMKYLVFIIIFLMLFLLFSYTEGYFLNSLFFFDSMSLGLVILSVWVSLLMIMASYKIYRFDEFSKYFLFFVLMLLFVLIVSFFTGGYLYFYFFFEVSLIPTLMIIVGWGYQPERLQAGMYFLFYTLTASLPLLILLIYLHFNLGSLSFFYSDLIFHGLNSSMCMILGMMGIMAFLVKLPMYFTHLWLPKAHVEAPVAGSMILAGVLLKLGGYGLMRLSMTTGIYMKTLSPYFVGLSLMGMIYVGFTCCRANDFKALVAYSSVAHMGMVVCGIMTLSTWGYSGALMMMIGHGLSSSGLFCIVNMYYERMGSRSFYINSGLMMGFPIFSMMMFLLSAANIAAPPTINLLSEIFLMASIMKYDYLMFLVFPLGSFLGAVFTLFMFSFSQHGAMYFISSGFSLSNLREIHILFLHVMPVNFLILNSSLLLSI